MSNYLYTLRPASFHSRTGVSLAGTAVQTTQTLWQGFAKGEAFPEDDARMRWQIEAVGSVTSNDPATDPVVKPRIIFYLYDDTNSVIVHRRLYVAYPPYMIPFASLGGSSYPAVVSGPRWGSPTPTADSKLRIYATWDNPSAPTYYATWTITDINVLAWRT